MTRRRERQRHHATGIGGENIHPGEAAVANDILQLQHLGAARAREFERMVMAVGVTRPRWIAPKSARASAGVAGGPLDVFVTEDDGELAIVQTDQLELEGVGLVGV